MMRTTIKRPASAALVCAVLVFAPSARAVQTFIVNSTLDGIDDDTSDGVCHTVANTCTLRAAVMQANRSSGPGATIDLPAGTYVLTRRPTGSDGDDSGDLDLTAPASGNPLITIAGAGASTTIIDANQIDRALSIYPSRSVALSGLTIRNGYSPSDTEGGAGLLNAGALTLDHIILTGNHDDYAGGAIANYGALIVRDSSLVSNFGGTAGGGLFNSNTGVATVTGTTIAFNAAAAGGGLLSSGSFFIVNSTIAANEASADGGGINQTAGFGNIYNSTIAYNDADSDADSFGYGGGVEIAAGYTLNLRNSLVVGNYVRGDPQFPSDCYGDGTLVPFGRNLTTTTGFCNVATSDNWALLNSLDFLGPLQNNGGPTHTIALLSGSNAIDTAGPCVDQSSNQILTDQRGFARTVGSGCDIGAYEFDPDRIFTDGFE